jgi:peptidoglycan/LPS O-acetylase OafA/YrhL
VSYCLSAESDRPRLAAAAECVARAAPAYRPDIDGLRAVAVTMVITYHLFPRLLPGGFTGVDVFFVISGYLITQLIQAGLQSHTFSLVGFYQRRVRRIVPALLVVLAACFAFGWFVLLPNEFRWLGEAILWSAPFLANVFYAHVTGYFDPGADYNLLLHLWTLGVEEQFYLLWPLLLIVAVRYRVTVSVLVAVIAASLAISLWGARYAPVTHFFLPGPRAWEFAIGALLATWENGGYRTPGSRLSGPPSESAAQSWALAGLVLIAAGALSLSAENTFPGGWAVIPAGGAALLIAAGSRSLVNRRLLGIMPVVFLGRLSYSLYLWHWPVLAFTRAIWGPELSPGALAGVIVVTLAAAFASYHTVEVPLRRGAFGRAAVPALLAGLAAFTALGAVAAHERLVPRLSGSAFTAWESAITDWKIPATSNLDTGTGFDTPALRTQRSATTLFIGDSHLQQYWPRITYLIDTHPDSARSVLFAAYAGCPILPGLNTLRQPRDCDGFFSYATHEALQPQVDTVVFGAFWELYWFGEFLLDRSFGVYSPDDVLHRRLRLDSPAARIALEQYEHLLTRLVSSGRRVFIVLSNPTSPQFDPRWLVPTQVRLSPQLPRTLVAYGARPVDAAAFETFVAPLMDRLRAIADRSGARILDPRTTLCEAMSCPAVGDDGMPLYIDSNHLRATYARERASFLDEALLGPPAQ